MRTPATPVARALRATVEALVLFVFFAMVLVVYAVAQIAGPVQ